MACVFVHVLSHIYRNIDFILSCNKILLKQNCLQMTLLTTTDLLAPFECTNGAKHTATLTFHRIRFSIFIAFYRSIHFYSIIFYSMCAFFVLSPSLACLFVSFSDKRVRDLDFSRHRQWTPIHNDTIVAKVYKIYFQFINFVEAFVSNGF